MVAAPGRWGAGQYAIRFYLNNCSGSFTDDAANNGLGLTSETGAGVHAADLDGDGDDDLVYHEDGRLLRNDSGTYSSVAGSLSQSQAASGDLNLDGQIDLVAFRTASPSVHLGAGAMQFSLLTTLSPAAQRVALFDADSDGDLDMLLVVESSSSKLYFTDRQ